MNYRHIYHAGNFADVFKHVLLVSLIESLLQKEKPFCYVDTHAGLGFYDLHKRNAQKTREFAGGILKLWNADPTVLPKALTDYLHGVDVLNEAQGTSERYYPGSPTLVRNLLRPADRMILTELHAEDVLSLKQTFLHDKQVAVHHLDGYQALKAFLPPKPARGLVLIDPPFEKTDEFSQLVQQLQFATKRWATGIFAVWYPIKNSAEVTRFYRDLARSSMGDILCCEFYLPPSETTALQACGMVVINPPWQWEKAVEEILPALCDVLSAPGVGRLKVKWLARNSL